MNSHSCLSFVLLLAVASPCFGQVKELPTCKQGYDYQLVDHQFVCTKITASPKSNSKSPSINERLDDLEAASDKLVPKVKKLIALCERAQVWSTVDNNHPEAVKVRDDIKFSALDVQMNSKIFALYVDVVKDEKMNAEQSKRFLTVMNEVNPLLHEMTRQLRRYEASQ